MDAQEKLTGLIKEILDPKMKDQAEALLDEVKSKNNTLEERLVALEAIPTKTIKIVEEPEEKVVDYKGRKLSTLGQTLNLRPEIKDDVSKMFIDFLETAMKNGKAAMNEGTTTQGGYMVFDEYISELLAFARLTSMALTDARVINVSSDSIHIPYEDTSVSVAWLNEAASITQSEPTVGELNLTPKKLAAYSISSNELLADSEFDVVSWLTSLYAEAIGQEFDNQMFNGSTWTGIVSASGINTVETTTNTTAGIDVDLFAQALTSLAVNKSAGAQFYMHRNGFRYVLALEDDAGNNIWSPGQGPFGSIWGVPVKMPEAFPSGVTGNDVIGIYGNLSHYIIAMRKSLISLDVDPFGAFLTDQTRFRGIVRAHGAPWNASAFTQIKI